MPTFTAESKIQAPYAAWIEIQLSRLTSNLAAVKAKCQPGTDILAVVKANAYGHGLLESARTLEGQVRYLGVSSLRELLTLKENQVKTPVFVFGRLIGPEIRAALMDGVTLTVSSLEEAQEISSLSEQLGRKTMVHIKADTGMGRFGIPFREAVKVIEKINTLPGLILEGLYTHYPTAELDDGFADRQLGDFILLIQALAQKGIVFRYRHAANSAGILKRDHPLLNMARPGLLLYGIYPDVTLKPLIQVQPVLALKSRIMLVKALSAGATAGYGRQFSAKQPTRIGILGVGYSHGYPFSAWQAAEVLIHGKRYQLAGRISMDYMAVHFKDDTLPRDEEVTLFGKCGADTLPTAVGTDPSLSPHKGGEDSIGADEVAQWADTIPYEIVTRLSGNLPRVYL